jgi:hypothetical protein
MAAVVHRREAWTRFSSELHVELQARGKGLACCFFEVRNHLPLRGKLGWMTPRAGVKKTLAIEARLPGLPVPSGSPSYFGGQRRGGSVLAMRGSNRNSLRLHFEEVELP